MGTCCPCRNKKCGSDETPLNLSNDTIITYASVEDNTQFSTLVVHPLNHQSDDGTTHSVSSSIHDVKIQNTFDTKTKEKYVESAKAIFIVDNVLESETMKRVQDSVQSLVLSILKHNTTYIHIFNDYSEELEYCCRQLVDLWQMYSYQTELLPNSKDELLLALISSFQEQCIFHWMKHWLLSSVERKTAVPAFISSINETLFQTHFCEWMHEYHQTRIDSTDFIFMDIKHQLKTIEYKPVSSYAVDRQHLYAMNAFHENIVIDLKKYELDVGTLFLVFGYIHKLEGEINSNSEIPDSMRMVPETITIQILRYYYINFASESERFNPELCCKGIDVLSTYHGSDCKQKVIKHKHEEEMYGTCYGTTVIPSMPSKSYMWKVGSNSRLFMGTLGVKMGIETAEAQGINDTFLHKRKAYYVYSLGSGDYIGWDEEKKLRGYLRLDSFRELSMKLYFPSDAKCGLLSFKKDDEDEFYVTNTIIRGDSINYRLAISMDGIGNCMEILEFKILHYSSDYPYT